MASITAAHAYAADQGLRLENETVEKLLFDDGTQLLLVLKGSVLFAYNLAPDAPTGHEQLVWTYPVQAGPSVLAARCSLDRGLLVLQRSTVLLELVDLATGNISVHGSERGRADLLGFFFTEWPEAEVVLVTRAGLELCTFAPRRQGLRCRERLKLPVAWSCYSHETRCCLVGTGPAGAPYVQAWQFLASGLVTLPPFALASPLAQSPRPAPSRGPPAAAAGPHAPAPAAPAAPGTQPGTGAPPGVRAAAASPPAASSAGTAHSPGGQLTRTAESSMQPGVQHAAEVPQLQPLPLPVSVPASSDNDTPALPSALAQAPATLLMPVSGADPTPQPGTTAKASRDAPSGKSSAGGGPTGAGAAAATGSAVHSALAASAARSAARAAAGAAAASLRPALPKATSVGALAALPALSSGGATPSAATGGLSRDGSLSGSAKDATADTPHPGAAAPEDAPAPGPPHPPTNTLESTAASLAPGAAPGPATPPPPAAASHAALGPSPHAAPAQPYGAAPQAPAGSVVSLAVPWGPSSVGLVSSPEGDLAAGRVRILKMYGRVYIAHLRAGARRLELHRVYTDTVTVQHVVELYSDEVDLSVVDNVLLVHHLDTGMVLLLDVKGPAPAEPVTHPLPLGALTPEPMLRNPRQEEALEGTLQPPPTHMVVAQGQGPLNMTRWSFHQPNLVVDTVNQVVYRMMLDLKAVAESCSDVASVVGFLQRRRSQRVRVQFVGAVSTAGVAAAAQAQDPDEAAVVVGSPTNQLNRPGAWRSSVASGGRTSPGPGPGPWAQLSPASQEYPPQQPLIAAAGAGQHVVVLLGSAGHPAMMTSKQLLLQVVRSALLEQLPLPSLCSMCAEVCHAYSEVAALTAGGHPQPAADASVLSPDEMLAHVLAPALTSGTLPLSYLQAALAAYMAALAAEQHPVPAGLDLLSLHLLQLGRRQHTAGVQLHCSLPGASSLLAQPLLGPLGAGMPGSEAASLALAIRGDMQQSRDADGKSAAASSQQPVTALSAPIAINSRGRERAHASPTGGRQLAVSAAPDSILSSDGAGYYGEAAGRPVVAAVPAPGAVRALQQLLRSGQVLRAARLVRDKQVAGVLPKDLLLFAFQLAHASTAPAGGGGCGSSRAGSVRAGAAVVPVQCAAAVYRCFRESLMPLYPSFEAACDALLPAASVA